MSVPSIVTENTSSTILDDDMSIIVHNSSDTTVSTQTSDSWHSVVSDIRISNNLFLRPHTINLWLKICSIEPDIRLTTAQEWKLRTCMRRLLSISNLPLKISCMKIHESIPYIDQQPHSTEQVLHDQLQQLGLYLKTLPVTDTNTHIMEVQLFEIYLKSSRNTPIVRLPLIKSPRLVFHTSTNNLKLNLRSANALLELRFSTRESDPLRGNYYQWNPNENEDIKYDITIHVDQSLIHDFNTE